MGGWAGGSGGRDRHPGVGGGASPPASWLRGGLSGADFFQMSFLHRGLRGVEKSKPSGGHPSVPPMTRSGVFHARARQLGQCPIHDAGRYRDTPD